MSLTRKEIDKIYEELKGLYRRRERDKDIHIGIDAFYQALLDYQSGKEIKRLWCMVYVNLM